MEAELDDIRRKHAAAEDECAILRRRLRNEKGVDASRPASSSDDTSSSSSGDTSSSSSGHTTSSSSGDTSSSSGHTSSSSGHTTSSSGGRKGQEETGGDRCDCASQAHSILVNTLEYCVRLHPAVGCELADIVDGEGRTVFAPDSCARMMLERITRAAHSEQEQVIASLAKAAAPQDAVMYDFQEIQLSSINR